MLQKKILFPLFAFLLIITIWEISSLTIPELELVLPAPSQILQSIFEQPGRFILHSKITLQTMLGGFFLALAIAFPIAFLMYYWIPARLVLQPLFVMIQCIPMFTLAPIMVIWFGWSFTAIVVPTALMIFFPLTINIYQGLHSTPKEMLNYFISNNSTVWQSLFKLQLPWALPQIFAGFRISAAIAGIGAIAGEWAGAQKGLGVLMLESRRGTDLETTFGALFCLTFLSLSFYSVIVLLEKLSQNRKFLRFIQKSSVFLLIPSLLLVSCQSKEPSKNNSSKEINLMLDWLPNPNHVPLFVGIEKGFFEEQGLNINIYKIQDPSDPLVYLTAGKIDIAISYMYSVAQGVKRNHPLKIVGILIDEPLNSIIYLKKIGIKTIEDLNDKTIGYSIDGTETRILDYLLKTNHIEPKDKYNVSFDLVSMLQAKRVDALYGAFWNIEIEQLRANGVETDYFPLTDFGMPTYYELVFAIKKGSEIDNPKLITAFQEAMQKSIDFCKQYPNEAFDIYANSNSDKSNKILAWEKKAWAMTIPVLAETQQLDQKIWDDFTKWLFMVEKE